MLSGVTVTRFAPSPNGSLHLGHAFSALVAHDIARARGGHCLLRIEDIDGARSRPELATEFRVDLDWLGLTFDEVPAQSARLDSYAAAADRLRADGLLYPCTCTRSQIEASATAAGPEGPIYPGTCKGRTVDPTIPAAWRLDMQAATARAGRLFWTDELHGEQVCDLRQFGDVVLMRKDAPASYHLAATLDDAADGVTLVTRGMDLFAASNVHRLLQALLDLPVPRWHHHALVLDETGQKLAKRRESPSLKDRRASGENGRELADALREHRFPAGITLRDT